MKSIRVPVLLLLASVHVFAQDSPDESVLPSKQPTRQPSTPIAQTAAPTATQNVPSPATATVKNDTVASPNPDTPTPDNKTSPLPSLTEKPGTGTAGPADQQRFTTVPSAVTQSAISVSLVPDSVSLDPRGSRPLSNSSETVNESNGTRGTDDSTLKPKPDAPTGASGTGTGRRLTVTPPAATQKTQKGGAGTTMSSGEKTSAKADKRLWLIVLPVLLVAAAAIIFLKFKCKKVHDHTETIDTGTENASFQSRPESTKDGVMLLGVRSSGGEENAAAR
ncbi:flocculation protein FLO11-like isoform X2 [Stegastes partitus]|uniref:Flocculation protein FLO11-like isoform X2 n=1 Tax=Stegastes partitus TaxID=144197 RepID=A0A9Y4TVT6_9TELE|nr:PREDICTED: flocculation protein FLO11-like isoform X2 [Stegastes partitus]